MENYQTAYPEGRSRPFFSVVIPVYNKAPHIHRALSSVAGQTFADFEIIVVDDASTDGSLDEIRKFADPRIQVFQRTSPGAGGYAARNLGIARSRADWVAFLDADDEWHSGHLALAAEGIRAYPDAGIVSSGWAVSRGGEKHHDAYFTNNSHRGQHLYTAETFMTGPRPICMAVAVARKELLKAAGGFDEHWPHGADTALWLRLLLVKNTQGLWLPVAGATYHMDAVNRVSEDIFQTFSPVAETAKRYVKNNACIPQKRKALLMRYSNTMSLKPVLRKLITADCSMKDISDMLFWGCLPLRAKLILMGLLCLRGGLRRKAALKILERRFIA
jgi:glycosyltransferase involved in cell wall biosynthesis